MKIYILLAIVFIGFVSPTLGMENELIEQRNVKQHKRSNADTEKEKMAQYLSQLPSNPRANPGTYDDNWEETLGLGEEDGPPEKQWFSAQQACHGAIDIFINKQAEILLSQGWRIRAGKSYYKYLPDTNEDP